MKVCRKRSPASTPHRPFQRERFEAVELPVSCSERLQQSPVNTGCSRTELGLPRAECDASVNSCACAFVVPVDADSTVNVQHKSPAHSGENPITVAPECRATQQHRGPPERERTDTTARGSSKCQNHMLWGTTQIAARSAPVHALATWVSSLCSSHQTASLSAHPSNCKHEEVDGLQRDRDIPGAREPDASGVG